MKKETVGFLMGCCLFSLSMGSGVAVAQEDGAGVTAPPAVLVIQREFLKPGKGGAVHERSEGNFVRAMTAAKWPSHYFGMTSLSGPTRALFFIGYDSFAAWEKDNHATAKNATLAGALDHASEVDGELLSSYDSSTWTYNEEQSLHAKGSIAEMRYMELTTFKVKPGHRAEWGELVKLYKSGFENVPTAHWATFENMYGWQSGDEYLVATALKSLSEVDQNMMTDKQFVTGLGEGGLKKLQALEAECLESVQSNVFEFNAKMSYPPDAWVKQDPGFWKPKAEAVAKKPEAAKPAQ
jgi:hypothetical protein